MPKCATRNQQTTRVTPVELYRVSVSLAERAADERERGLPNLAHDFEIAAAQAERRARQLEREMAPRTITRS